MCMAGFVYLLWRAVRLLLDDHLPLSQMTSIGSCAQMEARRVMRAMQAGTGATRANDVGLVAQRDQVESFISCELSDQFRQRYLFCALRPT